MFSYWLRRQAALATGWSNEDRELFDRWSVGRYERGDLLPEFTILGRIVDASRSADQGLQSRAAGTAPSGAYTKVVPPESFTA
jgi:hypothetical protein